MRSWDEAMSYATNGRDGARLYFEDEGGGNGAPVILYGGFPWTRSKIYASPRSPGHCRGTSFDPCTQTTGVSVAAASPTNILPLTRCRIESRMRLRSSMASGSSAPTSSGSRGEVGSVSGSVSTLPERVRSLVIGGNQPYAWPDSPLTRIVTEGLAVSREERSMEPMVRAFEDFWEVGFPEPQRERWLDNDPLALEAAWRAALDEEAIADDLGRWQIPCLVFLGAADADFLEGARRAAEEIPGAELLVLEEADHYTAHMSQDEVVLDAVLRTLRRRN